MILINGKQTQTLDSRDRGLQYGDGLFETIEINRGRVIFWQRHLSRLLAGCQTLQIPPPSIQQLSQEIQRLIGQTSKSAVLKILISRGCGGRGYRLPDLAKPTRILSLHPLPNYPESYTTQGITAQFCQTPLGINPVLAGLKHNNRLEQILARAELDETQIQEGLMVDTHQNVVEGTMTNLFIIKSGVIYTPPIDLCGVAGIMRSVIIDIAEQQNISLKIQYLTKSCILSADSVFLSNSIIGIWKVKQLEANVFSDSPLLALIKKIIKQKKRQEI